MLFVDCSSVHSAADMAFLFSGSFGTVHRADWHGSVRPIFFKFTSFGAHLLNILPWLLKVHLNI